MSNTLTTGASTRAGAILVIDDEMQIRRALADALADLSDEVLVAASGAEGLALAASSHPDLVILDLGLPDMAGVDVCRELRRDSMVPIVVLSARHAEDEKVQLLTVGADDYVTKPFGLAELVARVQAQLRRSRAPTRSTSAPMIVDGLVIDMEQREVSPWRHPPEPPNCRLQEDQVLFHGEHWRRKSHHARTGNAYHRVLAAFSRSVFGALSGFGSHRKTKWPGWVSRAVAYGGRVADHVRPA